MAKDTIGVGFIGAGDVSILHDRAVKKCPGARLVGLWNRSQDRAKHRAGEFGCKTYESPEALVNDPAVDAVLVLTNLETHLEYTKLALSAGKHVLVEKPVGVTVAEIEELKRLADSKKLVCMPGHNYIYEASMMRTRELVENGDLGRIVSCYAMYNIHHPEEVASRYPGVVRQILTHNSYILLYLVGRPKRLCAMKACLHYKTYTAYQGSVMNEVRHFLLDCLRHGAAPLSTMADAVTAQKMIEAAEQSIRDRTVVKL